MGEKIFIADKETLDNVHDLIGERNDNNSSGITSTLMGKLNYLVNTISNYVVALSNCKYNLDANVSSRQSESDAKSRFDTINANTGPDHSANANGNLSAKLAYVIDQLSTMDQKKLVSKQISFARKNTGGSTLILDIDGAGQFEYAVTSLGTSRNPLTIVLDDETFTFDDKNGTGIVGRFMNFPDVGLTRTQSDAFNNAPYVVWQPFYFKKRLRIYTSVDDSEVGFFRGHYSVYE